MVKILRIFKINANKFAILDVFLFLIIPLYIHRLYAFLWHDTHTFSYIQNLFVFLHHEKIMSFPFKQGWWWFLISKTWMVKLVLLLQLDWSCWLLACIAYAWLCLFWWIIICMQKLLCNLNITDMTCLMLWTQNKNRLQCVISISWWDVDQHNQCLYEECAFPACMSKI